MAFVTSERGRATLKAVKPRRKKRDMLTTQQAAAKEAAHGIFDYPARLEAQRLGDDRRRDSLPRFRGEVVGLGIAGDTLRVYLRDEVVNNGIEIPSKLKGLRVQRVLTPGFCPFQPRRQSTLVPAPSGVSVGLEGGPTGTFGCLIHVNDAKRFILSNNHVLAHTNVGPIGRSILQPGRSDDEDGAHPARQIARLSDFEPISFGSAANFVDAAIAELDEPNGALPEIMTIGPPANPPVAAFIGQLVVKHGRTTGLTRGRVVDISFDGVVEYGGRPAYFENQIVVVGGADAPFSADGDSGALIVEEATSAAVGLLFAGDGSQTVANPIDLVLNRFGATIVTG